MSSLQIQKIDFERLSGHGKRSKDFVTRSNIWIRCDKKVGPLVSIDDDLVENKVNTNKTAPFRLPRPFEPETFDGSWIRSSRRHYDTVAGAERKSPIVFYRISFFFF
mmetsp:Transcript_19733/g.46103  ORF Transcript_19733/g.46103 Transcript_19733/m.46103 type:complete len:107 (-) Transcript_19733:2159-2479(-)